MLTSGSRLSVDHRHRLYPLRQLGRDDTQSDTVITARKWSIWKAANIGLIVSLVTLALQIANGRGFELANYAQTASASTVVALAGQVLAAPLIFVIVALVVNIFKWRLPKSDARAIEGAIMFAILLLGLACRSHSMDNGSSAAPSRQRSDTRFRL